MTPLHPLPQPIQDIIDEAKEWLKDCERPGVVPGTLEKQLAEHIINWHKAVLQAHLDQITPDDATLRKWVENAQPPTDIPDEEIDGPW